MYQTIIIDIQVEVFKGDTACNFEVHKKNTQDRLLGRYVTNQYSKMDQLILSNPILLSTI